MPILPYMLMSTRRSGWSYDPGAALVDRLGIVEWAVGDVAHDSLERRPWCENAIFVRNDTVNHVEAARAGPLTEARRDWVGAVFLEDVFRNTPYGSWPAVVDKFVTRFGPLKNSGDSFKGDWWQYRQAEFADVFDAVLTACEAVMDEYESGHSGRERVEGRPRPNALCVSP